jgi:hypothetical protein
MAENYILLEADADLRHARERRHELARMLDDAKEVLQNYGSSNDPEHIAMYRQAHFDAQTLPPKIAEADRVWERAQDRFDVITGELDRVDREERAFWFRRFMLSLQIGNGAAFLATVAGVLQADLAALPTVAVFAWAPAIYFGLGVSAAGLLPLLMAARTAFPTVIWSGRAAFIAILFATTSSAGLFALGVGSVMVELTQVQVPAVVAAKAVEAKAADGGDGAPPAAPTVQGNLEQTRVAGSGSKPQGQPPNNQQASAATVSESTTPPATPPAEPARKDAPAPK